MTTLHAGGKFGGGGYKVSGGLHGVGVSAVNALSEWCEVEVKRGGQIHFQRYQRGMPMAAVEVIGKVAKNDTGTKTTFRFDREIFKGDLDYRFETVVQRFREIGLRNARGQPAPDRPARRPSDDVLLRRRHHQLRPLPQSQPGSPAPRDARRA